MARADHLPPVPKDFTEALIDLRVRYARAARLVWTLTGIILVLVLTLGIVARTIADLSDDLSVQRRIAEQQELQRRTDRAEQRYALCQRTPPPAAPLCDGFETLADAYRTEKVQPPK